MTSNPQITVTSTQEQIQYFLKEKYNLQVFFGVGANPRGFGNITILTLVPDYNLGFSPDILFFQPDTIGCRVNSYQPDENVIIKPNNYHYQQQLALGNVYIFNQITEEFATIQPKPELLKRQTFVLQNKQATPLWYALMKKICWYPNSEYISKICSVFTIPPNTTLEIQPKSFAILHYSPEQLQEGEIYKSIASGFVPARINLTQQCQKPSVTFSTDDNRWRLSENNQSCTIENIETVKLLSDYCITDITDDEPSDPYQNLIDISSPANFQNYQGQYISGSYKGTRIVPYNYPTLRTNCTQPTPFKLEPDSTNQIYLKANATISIKTEKEEDLIDTTGNKNDKRSLLGYFSGFRTDITTKLCCYYWSFYGDSTKWLVVPISESETFNGFIKKGASVYLKNLASQQYLCPKLLDTVIYLTTSHEPYPWVITTSIST